MRPTTAQSTFRALIATIDEQRLSALIVETHHHRPALLRGKLRSFRPGCDPPAMGAGAATGRPPDVRPRLRARRSGGSTSWQPPSGIIGSTNRAMRMKECTETSIACAKLADEHSVTRP
jgi:hypothetical protein